MNVLSSKPISTIVCAIIDKKVPIIQILMVGKNQSFVPVPADMVFHP